MLGAATEAVVTLVKKIRVLKITQQTEVGDDADAQEPLFFAWVLGIVNFFCQKIIVANGEQQQQHKHPTGFKIKKQTHGQQVQTASFRHLVHQGVKG